MTVDRLELFSGEIDPKPTVDGAGLPLVTALGVNAAESDGLRKNIA